MEQRPPRVTLGAPPGLVVETFDLGVDRFAILDLGAPPRPPAGSLTPAEREIMELLLAGLSTADIARRRRRSERTVAHQVDSIFRRMGVHSRLELFARYSREGR